MAIKKKLYIVVLVALFTLLLSLSTTSYAVDLTPIDQMNYDIAYKIFTFIKEKELCNYAYASSQTNYNTFYSNLTEEKINNFVELWNNSDIKDHADYLEQCIFLVNGWQNHNYLQIVFNNNTIRK